MKIDDSEWTRDQKIAVFAIIVTVILWLLDKIFFN